MIRAKKIVTVYGERYKPGQEIPEASWRSVRMRSQSAMLGLGIVEQVDPVNPLGPPHHPLHCKVEGCGAIFDSVPSYGGHMKAHYSRGEATPPRKRRKRKSKVKS